MDDSREAVAAPVFLGLKTVIRCSAFDPSYAFYSGILGLHPVEQWAEPRGRGCIFALESGGPGCLEIYEMTREDPRFEEAFGRPLASGKIDLQIRAASVDAWAVRLRGKWDFDGPQTLPWGQRWIRLRDPDRLLIAIYEESSGSAGPSRTL